MDRLLPLLSQFSPSVRSFHSEVLFCDLERPYCAGTTQLYLLRAGRLTVESLEGAAFVVEEPSMMFCTGAFSHRLQGDHRVGATVLSASVELGSGSGNPLATAFPSVMLIPLRAAPEIRSTLHLLFGEATANRCGSRVALDRLLEYFLILLVREVMHSGQLNTGMLAGFADVRLAKSLSAIHDQPGRDWTLDALSDVAGMSRARFAKRFREVVGTTPLDYLTNWRLSSARSLLKRGEQVKSVASSMGYQSNAAFTRAFSRRVGMSPSQWLVREARASDPNSAQFQAAMA